MTTRMKPSLLIGAATLPLFAMGAARADVVFELGNNPQPNEQNILYGMNQAGFTVTGATNRSDTVFDFTSTDTLYTPAKGQATITNCNTNGCKGTLTNIVITSPGNEWTDFIMNPLNGSGTATVTVTDNFDTTFMYDLGNGQNFLTMFTVNGEFMKQISIDVSDGSFQNFDQPRVSGLSGPAVPEPWTLALFAAGLAGLGWKFGRRSRRM